jgi:hypothetical protein
MATRRQNNHERIPLISRQQRHDPYSPAGQDFDSKEDRRPILGRVTAALSSLFSPVVNGTAGGTSTSLTPETTKNGDNGEYYEDTYNDLPWRCSFGTKEDVSVKDMLKPLFVSNIELNYVANTV